MPTVNDALRNALEFLESIGYRGGDVHDDLHHSIMMLQHHAPRAMAMEIPENRPARKDSPK